MNMIITIAEACGWQWVEGDQYTPSGWRNGNKLISSHEKSSRGLPRYPADLNACREMEEHLSEDLLSDYVNHLRDILHARESDFGWLSIKDAWIFVRATAAQRCEAFLKTIGKWEDMKEMDLLCPCGGGLVYVEKESGSLETAHTAYRVKCTRCPMSSRWLLYVSDCVMEIANGMKLKTQYIREDGNIKIGIGVTNASHTT
jgi:hypothetical protein